MASTTSGVYSRNAGEKSKTRRIGALLDLSRGEPPLTVMRRIPQKEPQNIVPSAPADSRSRTQMSRIPQGSSSHKPPTQVEANIPRPPLTHETQSWSTGSRSGIPTAKPVAPVGSRVEPPKQPRNTLRRKQSTMLKEPSKIYAHGQSRSDAGKIGSSLPTTSAQVPSVPSAPLERSLTQNLAEAGVRQRVDTYRLIAQPTQIYPELDRYRDIPAPPSRDLLGRDALYRLATEDLPPPTPQFSGASSHSQLSSFSASPSTRFSGSPGPGPYSRDTTPTSISSQSPNLVAPMRLPSARIRQQSPAETRPPVTRRRTGSVSNEGGSFSSDPQGLAAVREALTSSSSNSTVRAEEKTSSKNQRGHTMAPPNPPPRKSSQKFQKGRSTDSTQSSSQSSQASSQPTMRSSSPEKFPRPSHGRTASTARSPQRRPTPPSRPSRDGTPDLYYQFGGPVPIILSNLSSTSLAERRQSGQLQQSFLPKTTQRPSVDNGGSPRPSFSREATPAPRAGVLPSSQTSKDATGKANRAPSPNFSTFKSKFPLFSRRTKAGSEPTNTEKKRDKVPRKGPAAGTGHEGYGRVGAVKRRSSTALQHGITGPVSSSESLASTLSTDQFLLERMSPVIIAGGEVVENQNTGSNLIRTESNQTAPRGWPSPGARNLPLPSSDTREDNRQTLWPSPSFAEANPLRRPSDNSDLEVVMQSTLANRRAGHTRVSSTSTTTTIHTDDSSPDIQTEQSHILPPAEPAAKKLTKRAKSPRRWNLFGRSQASSSKKQESVPATVQISQNKPPAFYTILDSPDRDGVGSRQDTSATLRSMDSLPGAGDAQPGYDRRPSAASVTSQVMHAPPEKDIANTRTIPSSTIPQLWQLDTRQARREARRENIESPVSRPSRLPQVGRIPKVVARRPEQTSPKSFSRPFNRISVQLPPPPPTRPDQESVAKGPSPPESMASIESPKKTTAPTSQLKDQASPRDPSVVGQPGQEFLAFSPCDTVGGAEGSESSCSEAPGYVSHIPEVPEPTAPFGEDEVWDEYNDLLEDSPPSPTSSNGVPFPLETYSSSLIKKSAKPLESPTVKTGLSQDVRISVATAKTTTTSSHCSADMTARINAAFHFDAEPPVTPFSVSEFVSDYGDRNLNKSGPNQEPEASRRNSSSSHKDEKAKIGSKRSSQGSKRTSGSSRLSEETPLSQVNLRVGSMTVSKWLTFGHVLFSPVREDLLQDDSTLKRQSILVIDGLGNDDWSFYAAETYPRANFFNLSPRAPLPQEHQRSTSFPISPPNHHQIQFTSHANKFPFGPDSFTAVVFRFPSAAPEAHYRNIISEAQRVLKPGGFIEFSILDVDLNNVGGRARRAVRRLKEQISAQNPDFSLSSTADLILRLLGNKGFVDIKTCRVGVPVASSITKASTKDGKKDERSLAEMMNDKTELGDENITKMVSKVGRWWYNRCYEIPTGIGSSIWHDRALLAECEEWGTSLKLTVCHARIPEARGRIASI